MSTSNLNHDLNKTVINQNEKYASSTQSIYAPLSHEVTSYFTNKISTSLSSPPKASLQIHPDTIPEFPPSPPPRKTAKKTSTISKTSIKAIKDRAKEMRTKQSLTPLLKEPDNAPFIVSDAPDTSFLSLPPDEKDTSLFVLGKGKRKISFSAPCPFGSQNFSSAEKLSDEEPPFFLNSVKQPQISSLIPPPLKKRSIPSPAAKSFIRNRAKKLRSVTPYSEKSQSLSPTLDISGTKEAFSSPPKRKNLNDIFASTLSPKKKWVPPLPSLFSSEIYDSPPQIKKGAKTLSTSSSTNISALLPDTPLSHQSRRKQAENQFLFSDPLTAFIDSTLEGVTKTGLFDPHLVYKLNETPHNLVKQAGGKSCGAASLLMLYTDIVRQKGISFALDTSFWTWYRNCTLTQASDICSSAERYTNLSANKLKLESLLLPCDESGIYMQSAEMHISEIKKRLISSGLPCMLSITHPKIDGHWIIIDAINTLGVTLRDPFAGKAYHISRADLISLFSDDPQRLIYCTEASSSKEEV